MRLPERRGTAPAGQQISYQQTIQERRRSAPDRLQREPVVDRRRASVPLPEGMPPEEELPSPRRRGSQGAGRSGSGLFNRNRNRNPNPNPNPNRNPNPNPNPNQEQQRPQL